MAEWIISSSVLILVLILLRYLLRGRISPRLQYALWALALVRLLVPVSFGNTPISVMNAVPEDAFVLVGVPEGAYTGDAPVKPVPAAHPLMPDEQAEVSVNTDLITDFTVKVTDWGVIARTLWLSGTAVIGLCLIISNLRFALRLKRARRGYEDAQCAPLQIYISDAVDTPCLFGVFRPAIYLTPEAAEDANVLRHSIEHETTHFRRLDHIWAILRGLCLALHWYNPLVWWAAFLSRRDSELSCDEATISRIGESERAEYGRTLIGLTCQKPTALLITATTMTSGKAGIKERIRLMAKKPKTALWALMAVVLTAAVAAGCTFTGAAEPTPPEVTEPAVSFYTFSQTEEYGSIVITDPLGDMAVVPPEYMEEMSEWLRGFKRGDMVSDTDTQPPGLNSYKVTIRYAGGGGKESGIDVMDFAGKKHYILRDATPECWEEIWDSAGDIALYIYEIFHDGGFELTLYAAGVGACNTFYTQDINDARFVYFRLRGYAWTRLEAPPPEPSDYWLTYVSGGGARSMTVWDGETGTVQLTDPLGSTWWRAEPVDGQQHSIAFELRQMYDNMEVSIDRISPFDAESAEAAAYKFVHEAYGGHRKNLSPGNAYGISDYGVASYKIVEVSEDGKAVVCYFNPAFIPWDINAPGVWAGNTTTGQGEWEGWAVESLQVCLQLSDDGLWRCDQLGTGGVRLP